ncbi:DNA primase small subunit [Lachnellula hyalina]|uniref:DNA primase n=1 Tax=Lachnellula hyalina TaxID=1316788 RepID=A0A8H8U432_9HELO|nr:DNA primase small subunit [Lachnellula hyalina]TVY30913.1 DNA primase small subunit [Lachnellula hyalina]
MPHSVSPANSGTPDQVQDDMVVEPQPQAENGETQNTASPEIPVVVNTEPENGSTQGDEVADQDMAMEDVGVQGEKVLESAVKEESKSEVKLEDLFADVESDEEFPSSAALNVKPSSPPEAPSSPVHVGPASKPSDSDVMRSFYQRLFPWRHLFQWLNHSPTPSTDFGHREFAFTLQNDAYLRYQSFPTSDLFDSLRKDVLRLMPSRFEIGPVYTTNPRDRKTLRKSSAFKPLAKEICFDIDLTDYDDIRTCCDKANICNKCWQFITMAVKVIDVALRDDFGFKHILWVYSGRRGAHAWVCDKKARFLDDQKRRAIAGYLEVIKGGAQSGKRVNVKRPLHPHVARSLEVLKSHFQTDILHDQDPWETDEKFDRLLQLLPDKALNEALRKKWSSAPGRASTSKWADIDALAKSGASKTLDAKALLEAKQDIVLEYTYPRLDIEVSKHLNHLLKSPFVVHPGTGRVCVPINTKDLESFDPLEVPTVTELLGEIDEWTPEGEKEGKAVQDWEKTSLKPYVEYLRSFVVALMKDEKDVKVKREREENTADAMEF